MVNKRQNSRILLINSVLICYRFKTVDIATTERRALLNLECPAEMAEAFPAKKLWLFVLDHEGNGLHPFRERMIFEEKLTNSRNGSYAILFSVDQATATYIHQKKKGKLFGPMTSFTVFTGETNRPMVYYPREVVFKYRM